MVNKAIIIGHVGQDPEVRYTGNVSNGVKVATMRVATSEKYKDKQGNVQELTEWHSIVCWRGLADVVEKYVKKGTLVYIEGKIQSRSWEDNGVKKYATDIIANSLQLLSKKEGGSQQGGDPYVAGARQMQEQQQKKKPGDIPVPEAVPSEDKEDAFIDKLLAKPPNAEKQQKENPADGRIAKSRQSVPTCVTKEGIARGDAEPRPSVRQELKQIREDQAQTASKSSRKKNPRAPQHQNHNHSRKRHKKTKER